MTDLAIFLMDLGGGGAERVMLNLARGFSEKGLAVDLVLVQTEGVYLTQLPPQIRVVEFKKSRLMASIPDLVRYLRQTQPTVLMSALEDTNFVALWAKKLAGVATQVIVTVHNHLSNEAKYATQLKRQLTPHLVKLFYPWADNVVAVSQGVADDLLDLGLPAHKINVVYNPIVTSELAEKAQEPVAHPWFLNEQPPVILGIGRLTKQKNFSMLIRAFGQVREHYPVRLAILGEGEEQAELKALVNQLNLSEHVAFLGFVDNPYAYLARAAVLVLSSLWEGFGNVIVEAIAVGTPVVSTNCRSGPAEILNHGEYGSLVSVENIKEMADAIVATIQSVPDQAMLKQRSQEFTLEKAVERYEALLETVNEPSFALRRQVQRS